MNNSELTLADRLAINYVNVSVATNNPDFLVNRTNLNLKAYDDKAKEYQKLLQFFKPEVRQKYKYDNFGFSRNILIIGNGASIDFTKSTNFIIDSIEKEFHFDNDSLRNDPDKKAQYLQKANHCIHDFISDKFDIDIVKRELLQFEGRLSVLGNFVGSHEVVKELKKHVNFKYQSSGFYELVAHLFKHRFIDVIINFNFDEMLDNAIEDEMGDNRMFMKVVNDSDCKKLQRICDDERLKMPIYIKPHGTISSESSMLFTKEQYIEISPRIKKFMDEILHGYVGTTEYKGMEASKQPTNIVKRFNFIIAGFSMKSIEFNEILFSQLVNPDIQEVNYFIYNKGANATSDVLETIKSKILYWQRMCSAECNINKVVNIVENDIGSCLADEFVSLYDSIRSKFEKPFEPMPIIRHRLLSKLFPVDKIKDIPKDETSITNFLEFIKRRILFNMLYDLIKFRGIYISNISIGDRAGKYYRTYLKENTIFAKDEDSKYCKYKMKDLLEEALSRNTTETNNFSSFEQLTDVIFQYIPYKRIIDNNYEVEQLEQELEVIHRRIIQAMVDNSYEEELRVEDLMSDLKISYNDIYDTGINEINPVYSDPKLGRFYHFKKDRIIPTNLGFTYKFFDYATNRISAWDELWFADDTGKAIYNLHSQISRKEDNYLRKIILSNRNIRILHSMEKIVNCDNRKRMAVSKAIFDLFSTEMKADNISIEQTDPIFNLHRMALFLKKPKMEIMKENTLEWMESCEPVFGIYSFKARTKNRINPVFFECEHRKHIEGVCNERKNLDIMKKLFIDQYDFDLRNEYLLKLLNMDIDQVINALRNLADKKKIRRI